MKRLLILGGSRYIIPVIKKAKELGIFVITCDYLPNNFAHKYSDKYLNISIIDRDAVLAAAKKENIDGIISFACDPGVVTASYVAEQLNLPNVGPYSSVCVLQNKALFRDFLRHNGFNTPYFKKCKNVDEALKDSKKYCYPIIVKPTDSAGSKGVKKVNTFSELKSAVENAFNNSIKKEIIIEEYVEYVGHPSDADSFVKNGKILYFGTNSQLFDSSAENPFTPAAYCWPSTFSKKDIIEFESELNRMFKLLKIETSIFNIELRKSKNNKLYIMEASPRGGGNRLLEIAQFGTKQNMIETYLKYCVNLEVDADIKQIEFDEFWCEIILHSKKNGAFQRVEISDKYINNIFIKDVWVNCGDSVSSFTGANQTIGTIIMKFESEKSMNNLINDVDNCIKVVVE